MSLDEFIADCVQSGLRAIAEGIAPCGCEQQIAIDHVWTSPCAAHGGASREKARRRRAKDVTGYRRIEVGDIVKAPGEPGRGAFTGLVTARLCDQLAIAYHAQVGVARVEFCTLIETTAQVRESWVRAYIEACANGWRRAGAVDESAKAEAALAQEIDDFASEFVGQLEKKGSPSWILYELAKLQERVQALEDMHRAPDPTPPFWANNADPPPE